MVMGAAGLGDPIVFFILLGHVDDEKATGKREVTNRKTQTGKVPGETMTSTTTG
jgi:hypothetical protein